MSGRQAPPLPAYAMELQHWLQRRPGSRLSEGEAELLEVAAKLWPEALVQAAGREAHRTSWQEGDPLPPLTAALAAQAADVAMAAAVAMVRHLREARRTAQAAAAEP